MSEKSPSGSWLAGQRTGDWSGRKVFVSTQVSVIETFRSAQSFLLIHRIRIQEPSHE